VHAGAERRDTAPRPRSRPLHPATMLRYMPVSFIDAVAAALVAA
jgi:hypothetical protein